MPMQFFPQQNIQAPPPPEKPQGLGGVLGAAIGQGLAQGVTSSLNNTMYQKQIDRAIGGLSSDASPQEIFAAASQLPPEAQQLFVHTYMPAKEMEQKQARSAAQQQAGSVLDSYILKTIAQEEGIDLNALHPENIEKLEPKEVSRQFEKSEQLRSLAENLPNVPFEQKKFMLEQLQKNQEKKEKQTSEEGQFAYKENKEYIDKVKSLGENYRTKRRDLSKMEALNKSGKLSTAWKAKAADIFGVQSILTPESQQFNAMIKDQISDIKSIFGARPTNFDVSTFLKSLPTLSNDQEGREAIISYQKFKNEAAKAKYDSYKEVMSGRRYPTLDLQERVGEKFNDKLDKLEEELNQKTGNKFKFSDEEPVKKNEISSPEKIGNKIGSSILQNATVKNDKNLEEETPEEKKGESWEKWSGRQAARSASRVAETIGGTPGNIAELAKSIDTKKYPGLSNIQQAGQDTRKVLPTSEDIKKFSESITGGFTKQNSDAEKWADEAVEDVAGLWTGGAGNLKKAMAIGGLANALKTGSGFFTSDENVQNTAKMGTLFLGSVRDPKRAGKFVDSLYNDAKQLSKDGLTNSKPLLKNLEKIEEKWAEAGYKTSSTNKAQSVIDGVKKILQGDHVPVDSLVTAKKNINEELGNIWSSAELGKPGKKAARDHLLSVKKSIDKSIESYGEHNKEFYKKYKAADAAFAANALSKEAVENIHEFAEEIGAVSKMGKVLGYAYKKGIQSPPFAVPKKFMMNPDWRRYYFGVLKSGIENNKVTGPKNLSMLLQKTDELKEEE